MNDQELSTMLQEWPATPAPETLEERVFGPVPLPVPWWGKVPAGALALLGTAVGALVMSLLFMLVPKEPAAAPPAPAPSAPVAAPEPPPPMVPTPAPPRKRKAVPKVEAPPVTTGVTLPPRVVYSPMPSAPDPAVITSVGLRLRIDKEGRVVSAEFLEGDKTLADLAIEAVLQWRYTPEMVNGEPLESSTVVSVTFGPRPRPAKAKAR